jgi:tetratricopeptide (TPR) repeat protein
MLAQSLIFAMLAQVAVISGQVRDARTHSAIAMAAVELWKSQTPVNRQYTDMEGRFHFVVPESGHFTVAVDYPGYEKTYEQIDMSSDVLPIVIELRKTNSGTNLRPSISIREFLVPKNARQEFDRARKEVARQNCTKAIDHFRQGLRIFDHDASAHNDLGNCYRRLNQLDRAEESFNRARALSDSVYIRLNLAELYSVQRRFEAAEAVLLEAVRKPGYIGDAYYGLALIYFQQGLSEKAVAAALKAHEYPHQVADVHLVLAEIYSRDHRSADAAQELEIYVKEAPNSAASEQIRRILKSSWLDNPGIK